MRPILQDDFDLPCAVSMPYTSQECLHPPEEPVGNVRNEGAEIPGEPIVASISNVSTYDPARNVDAGA
jgi:hypothetical protein